MNKVILFLGFYISINSNLAMDPKFVIKKVKVLELDVCCTIFSRNFKYICSQIYDSSKGIKLGLKYFSGVFNPIEYFLYFSINANEITKYSRKSFYEI